MVTATEVIRLLVVEDDEQMGALLERGLADEGYEVTVAVDGVQGLIHAHASPPSIAVLDVMLPGMSGFELCRRLREADPTVRVLMLTARDDLEDRIQGLDSGADDYLVKPFEFRELAARLRALRRRDAFLPQTRLAVGDVTLDALERMVRVQNHALHLSPKEFSVLRVLMTHEGEVVSRAALLSEVWGTTVHADANIVDQYVSYLRKKLEQLDAGLSIVTERGVGFRLSVGE